MKRQIYFFILLSALFFGIIFISLLFESNRNPNVVFEIVEQCEDGIQNYDETGVDCGGSCAACAQEPSGSSGGGGGGGGGGSIATVASVPAANQTQSVDEGSPGSPIVIEGFEEGTGIKEIRIEVKTEVQDLIITVSGFDGRPETVTGISGKVYRYLKIDTENLEDNLEKATITFPVEKSWFSDNGLGRDDVAMFKFDEVSEEWNEQKTSYISEDDSYNYYDVELTSFSYFVIGEKSITEKIGEGIKIGLSSRLKWLLILAGIFFVIFIIVVVIWRVRKNQSEVSTLPQT